MRQLKFIDLFSGIGGFRVALENIGAKCVFSSEIDKWAAEVYNTNFKEQPKGDITKIKSEEIPNHNILCAGFPCQPFSIGGLRKGFEDTRGTLFFDVARILSDKQPQAFLLENVKGIVSHDDGKTLKTIMDTLDEIGYICDYRVMNALDYGVPQNRERWYCVGFKKNMNIGFNEEFDIQFKFPEKRELELFIEDIIENNVEGHNITEKASENIDLFLNNFKNKSTYNKDRYIIANEIRPSRCSFRNNGVFPCFTAKMGTGGNNVPVIVEKRRKVTVRECLKVMGFPDSFIMKENYNQSYKQIGNSVVVSIISMLAEEIKNVLDKI
ncbi:DNA cytosine methyltransferase [Clostridium perfringens]